MSEEDIQSLREAKAVLRIMLQDAISMQQELAELRRSFTPSGDDLAGKMKRETGDGTKLQRIINNLEPVIDAIDWNLSSIQQALDQEQAQQEVEL